MIIGAITMAATSAQAQNRSEFDLICDVKFSTHAEGFPLMEAERTLRFSVDTDAMKWCREECADVEDLVEATGAKLTLWAGSPQPDMSRSLTIDRLDGLYLLSWVHRGTTSSGIGKCEAAPFTGIEPKPRF